MTPFATEIAARFGDFLGMVEPIGPRWTYPLSLMVAERYVADRLALVGEAAHVIHPIAGQGLNLGIRDVAALAEVIIDRRRLGLDIGDPKCSPDYQQWRRLDTLALAAVTDGLNRLFSNRVGTAAPRPRPRPRGSSPPAGAQAPPDARRNGARGRSAAPRPRRAVVELIAKLIRPSRRLLQCTAISV